MTAVVHLGMNVILKHINPFADCPSVNPQSFRGLPGGDALFFHTNYPPRLACFIITNSRMDFCFLP